MPSIEARSERHEDCHSVLLLQIGREVGELSAEVRVVPVVVPQDGGDVTPFDHIKLEVCLVERALKVYVRGLEHGLGLS